MNIFRRVANQYREFRSWAATDDRWYAPIFSILPTSSGVAVNEHVAQQQSTFFACKRVLSETIASLPLDVFEDLGPGKGKRKAKEHNLYEILHNQPNPEMTAFTFWDSQMGRIIFDGNSYSEIQRDRYTGDIKALWPLVPSKMKVVRSDAGNIHYLYTLPDGKKVRFKPEQIFHLKSLSSEGLTGQSVLSIARQALGLAIATETHGAGLFKNGCRPGVVLEHPGTLSEAAEKNIVASWEAKYGGLDNGHRLSVLREGMKLNVFSFTPEESQFLETRKFSVEEVARMFRMQLHMIGHLDHATFSNIEHQAIEHVVHTLRPWLVNLEQSIRMQLFGADERGKYYAKFNVNGLLRGDSEARHKSHEIGKKNGWLTTNDIRRLEDLNPSDQEGADILYQQNIWTKLGEAAPALTMPTTDKPAPEPPPETKSASPIIEMRSVGIGDRNRLRAQYEPLFRDAASRIVRVEVNELRGAVKKYFGKRSAPEFEKWMDGFYDKFPEKLEKNFTPLVQSYGAAISDVASREAGGSGVLQSELDDFVKGYVEVSAKRHVGSSRGQIKKIIREVSPDEIEAVLNERLDEWDERRAEKIASREPVEASDAFAKMAWIAAGVTRYMWVAQGSKPCPYCEELNGMIVGMDQSFVSEGGSVSPDGQEPMEVRGAKMHAPLHGGCVCSVEPA